MYRERIIYTNKGKKYHYRLHKEYKNIHTLTQRKKKTLPIKLWPLRLSTLSLTRTDSVEPQHQSPLPLRPTSLGHSQPLQPPHQVTPGSEQWHEREREGGRGKKKGLSSIVIRFRVPKYHAGRKRTTCIFVFFFSRVFVFSLYLRLSLCIFSITICFNIIVIFLPTIQFPTAIKNTLKHCNEKWNDELASK